MQAKPVLKVSAELWQSLKPQQQQEQREKFEVKVAQPYAPAPDLDLPVEMAPVAREVK